ncbi:MAG: cupredoxin domain-containing protein [Acidimicrobiales bacterium]
MTPPAARVRQVRALAALAALVVLAVAIPVGVAAAGGGDDAPPAGLLTVHVTAHHSRFTPASVDVAPGTTVRFVIRNLDPVDHEFIVGGPEVQKRHEIGRDAGHLGQEPGAVSVPAGATASTTWTAPATHGPVQFACHLPGHFAYGMAGVVNVTR